MIAKYFQKEPDKRTFAELTYRAMNRDIIYKVLTKIGKTEYNKSEELMSLRLEL
jgi:hypothetical protein